MENFKNDHNEPLPELHHQCHIRIERERKQMVSFLNDTIIQSLTALHIQLSSFNTPSDRNEEQKVLADALEMTLDLVEDVSRYARKLRPIELDIIGLDSAIKQASEEFERLTGIDVIYERSDLPTISEEKIITFFRLVQTAFETINARSRAAVVMVSLKTDGKKIALTIMEDFDKTLSLDSKQDVAFDTIAEQFQQLGGFLQIQPPTKQGLCITAVLPA